MKRALLFAAFLPLLGVSSFAQPLEGRGPTPVPASLALTDSLPVLTPPWTNTRGAA